MGSGVRSKAEIDSQINSLNREIKGLKEVLSFKKEQMRGMTSKAQKDQWKSDIEGINRTISNKKDFLAKCKEERRNAK